MAVECQLTADLDQHQQNSAEVPRTGDEDALVGEHLLLITDDSHVLLLRTVLAAEVELGSWKVGLF